MTSCHGVLLDEASYNLGDLDMFALITQVDSWDRFGATDEDQCFKRLQKADIAVINKIRMSAELISSLPELKLILLTATGTDNVDLDSCRAHGITVCNVTDYGTASVAQHVFALMLALSTNLLNYARQAASGEWSRAEHFSTLSYPVTELHGKTLGLVGYGTLAKGVEKLAHAFGMRCILAQRPGGEPRAGRLPMDELLTLSDVISLHCPLVPETRNLINTTALQKMKPSAILINTARGAVVDNVALASALKSGQIKAAGIDVLEQEPPPADHPLLQADVPNVIVTPHTAWASIESRQRLLDKVAQNLRAWIQGEPINVVS